MCLVFDQQPNEIELSGGPEAADRNTPSILSHKDLTARHGWTVRWSERLVSLLGLQECDLELAARRALGCETVPRSCVLIASAAQRGGGRCSTKGDELGGPDSSGRVHAPDNEQALSLQHLKKHRMISIMFR